MAKKKPFKVLIITFFCVCLTALLGFSAWFLFNNLPLNNTNSEEVFVDRYFIAQTAIFHNEYSQNYNGTFRFERVNFVYLSKLSTETQEKIYKKFKVSDTMSLINALTKQTKSETNKYNELLIIQDGTYQFNRNSKPYIYGDILGNDDYSILYNKNGKKLFSASLSNISETQLKTISANEIINYHGAELYLTKTMEIELEDKIYYLDVVYVYVIQ